MKTFLMTSAFVAAMTTASFAGDFDTTVLSTSLTSGAMDFNVDATENGMADLAVGVTAFSYSAGGFDSSIRGELSYNLDADTIGLRGEYNVVRAIASNATVYGSAAVEYVTAETDLADGDVFLDPSVGVTYAFTDAVSVFGEVGYTWNVSNDWDRLGGYVEVGLPVNVTDSVTVTPSLVRGIDDGVEETNAKLAVVFAF